MILILIASIAYLLAVYIERILPASKNKTLIITRFMSFGHFLFLYFALAQSGFSHIENIIKILISPFIA